MPVYNMACPKCGKQSTEYAEDRWQCLHCGNKFIYKKENIVVVNQERPPVGAAIGLPREGPNDFEKASREKPVGIVREFLQFLAENKKWWLLPIVLVLVVCSLLAIFATSFAPYIYTLF